MMGTRNGAAAERRSLTGVVVGDSERFANFDTAGCSKCRYKGCRACRGYTKREYKEFLAQSGLGGRALTPGVEVEEGVRHAEEVSGAEDMEMEALALGLDADGDKDADDNELNGSDETNETNDIDDNDEIATPSVDRIRRYLGDDDGQDVNRVFNTKKKAGCSKCRFRGCKKCRGYTLAELRAYEASQVGFKINDARQEPDDDVVSPRKTMMGMGRKRTRDAALSDDPLLDAGRCHDKEVNLSACAGVPLKKTRWAIGALSGLKAKVMSAVSKPLNALTSLSFWGRNGSDEEGGADECDDGRPAFKDGELCDGGDRSVIAVVEFEGAQAGGKMSYRSLSQHSIDRGTPSREKPSFPHLLARPNRAAPSREKPSFPHLLARPNREAPLSRQRKQELLEKSNNVEAEKEDVVRVDTNLEAVTKTTPKAVDRPRKGTVIVQAPSIKKKKKKKKMKPAKVSAMTLSTRTPPMPTKAAGRALTKPTKTRSTRLSASKVSIKGKATRQLADNPKTNSRTKAADNLATTRVTETPRAACNRGDCDEPDILEETCAPGSSLVHEISEARVSKNVDMEQAIDVGLQVEAATNDTVQKTAGRCTPALDHEQHSTPTPEVSFSFADMAGASKDTISAEQLQQLSQEEQGPRNSSRSGLSPLRLPGTMDSDADFAFAEALQAFSSPDHDHRAVTRAMNVVGNLMSDLDMSPETITGRPNRGLGKGVRPMFSPSFDFVDPNASSPALSPVTFAVQDGSATANRISHGTGGSNNRAFTTMQEEKRAVKGNGNKSHDSHQISSLAAEQGSFKSAKHLLQKKMVLKQASQDALYMKVREVIINRHLVEIHRQGHDWASLDACGVPLDLAADHTGIEAKVLRSVREEYGDDTLQKLIAQVEHEWKHMCSVRQKYSKEAARAASGQAVRTTTGNGKTTPTRSILRQQRSSERLRGSHTLRWAPENVQHTYTLTAPQETDEREKDALRPPSSTRGLRMLGLASASPKGVAVGNGSGGRVSPLPPSPTGLAAMATPGSSGGNGNGPSRRRSRTQNIHNTGTRSSQGHRLFQALQNASCIDAQQPSHTPRTLSMIFDALPEDGNDHDHSNNNSSGGPANSDTTTSSNSSRGSGGGGRWEQAEVEQLIRGFKEWASNHRNQYVWKFIGDAYRGNGLSDCRTNDDLKSKWKAMRKTAGKNRRMRYVKLTEDELEFLRSEASKP